MTCIDDGFDTVSRNENWGFYGVNDLAAACANCCTDNCIGWVDGGGGYDSGPPDYYFLGNITCCSGNHQTCLSTADCCNQGATQQYKCDLNTVCNKDAGQCNDGGSIGVCCLTDGQGCGIGSDCCSGNCDAGLCVSGC